MLRFSWEESINQITISWRICKSILDFNQWAPCQWLWRNMKKPDTLAFHHVPWEPTTFIFTGHEPICWGPKTICFYWFWGPKVAILHFSAWRHGCPVHTCWLTLTTRCWALWKKTFAQLKLHTQLPCKHSPHIPRSRSFRRSCNWWLCFVRGKGRSNSLGCLW